MTWFTYEIPPLDNNWEFCPTVKEVAKRIGSSQAAFLAEHGRANDVAFTVPLDDFLGKWESAQSAAYAKGWYGDFRNEPVVFMIPDETDFHFGFVIKQDNNGTTYVVSPVDLPHLAHYDR